MTQPTQSVAVRRAYYASGTPPVLPVLYDNAYDNLPNVDVLDLVLAYDGMLPVQGYSWNGIQQVPNSSPAPTFLPQIASASLLLNLQADTLTVGDGNPVSLWLDASGNHHDFNQSDDARPTFRTDEQGGYVEFSDTPNQRMLSTNFINGLESFAVFTISADIVSGDYRNVIGSFYSDIGWYMAIGYFNIQNDASLFDGGIFPEGEDTSEFKVRMAECTSFASKQMSVYINNNNSGFELFDDDSFSSYINNGTNLVIGGVNTSSFAGGTKIKSVLIYQITDLSNWATDRTSIVNWLLAQ